MRLSILLYTKFFKHPPHHNVGVFFSYMIDKPHIHCTKPLRGSSTDFLIFVYLITHKIFYNVNYINFERWYCYVNEIIR